MKRDRFIIPGLAVAGLALNPAQMAPPEPGTAPGGSAPQPTLYKTFRLDHAYTLAGHRSHSSHSSHSSHRSSSGGGSTYRSVSPPPPPPPPPSERSNPNRSDSTAPSSILPLTSTPQKVLPGNSAKFTDIVTRVQLGLRAYGYYSGIIDGLVGPETQAALTRFQTDFNLPVTGTVTPQVLDALGIAAQ